MTHGANDPLFFDEMHVDHVPSYWMNGIILDRLEKVGEVVILTDEDIVTVIFQMYVNRYHTFSYVRIAKPKNLNNCPTIVSIKSRNPKFKRIMRIKIPHGSI